MHTFKDIEGREWQLIANVTTLRRVKDTLDVDLTEFGSPDAAGQRLVETLTSDPYILADVLCCLCLPQMEKAGVTQEQFGEALAGDAIDNATGALLDEIVSFFPKSRDRLRAARVLKAMENLQEKAQDLLDAKASDEAINQMGETLLAELGESSTRSPEPSESTPAP